MYNNHLRKQHKELRDATNTLESRFSFRTRLTVVAIGPALERPHFSQEREKCGTGSLIWRSGPPFSPREVNSSNAGRAPSRRTTDRQPGIPCGSDHTRECYP